ncbi:MAG: DUF6512 family protein [Firmicutes bacterium]|nr:DUF6512 family protein [Bacillota bacterium]
MNQLKRYLIIGTIFVIILGTLSHFFYDWSNNNFVVGFFSPVNESTWEHMKLVFFPMLLFSLIANYRLKSIYPCITSSLLFGILLGTFLIPIFFYTYTGILGYNVLVLDLITFILAVICSFSSVYRLTLSCRMQNHTTILFIAVCVVFVCFILFTVYPPSIALFTP